MAAIKTDLTLEAAHALLEKKGGQGRLSGVTLDERQVEGYAVTAVSVRTPYGARALGKPRGTYITVDLAPYFQRQEGYFSRGVRCLAEELRHLLPPLADGASVLVAGLGNRSMICDAVGPMAVDHLLVTRHLIETLPSRFSTLTSVAALAPGVVGQTGMETLEVLAGTVRHVKPAAVVVIDALTASSRGHLCATVQLSDTGLVPGSGVGNHRSAIDRKTLGVPVIAVGLPTVMAEAVLAQELTGAQAQADTAPLFVTPRDVDSRVRELGRLLGYGINAALQPSLTVEEITGLLG